MKPQNLIIGFSAFIAFLLGVYIYYSESETNIDSDQYQVLSNKELTTNNNKSIRIGELKAHLPSSWTQENPSNSMRLAQFLLPGGDNDTRLVVFFGIGGTIRENLERWYNQFEVESIGNKSKKAIEWTENINSFDVIFTYLEGTYLKSNMRMSEPIKKMKNFALLAAIISAAEGKYYFKITGPVEVLNKQKEEFNMFIRSIDSF